MTNSNLVESIANLVLALSTEERDAVLSMVSQQMTRRQKVSFDLGPAARFWKIALIKAVRHATGMGLGQAKAVVEGMEQMPVVFSNTSVVSAINEEYRNILRERISRTADSFCTLTEQGIIQDYLNLRHYPCTIRG